MNRQFLILFQFTCALIFALLFTTANPAQEAGSLSPDIELYNQIRGFDLNGGQVDVSNLTIKRDRVVMNLTGTVYLAAPINGRSTGAVFIGNGSFKADPPPNDFEKAHVRRMTKADNITVDFKSAFFRFTDDTATLLGQEIKPGSAPPQAVKIASEANAAILKETGANLASRVMISILNKEDPGFFFAVFDGGRSGKVGYVLDHQNRIPTAYFGINGGEKGLLYTYKSSLTSAEVLMAFYSEQDYERNLAAYSDMHDLVDIEKYDVDIDLRSPKSKLGVRSKMGMIALADGVRAIPFQVGENLGEYEDARLKRQMRVKAARSGETSLSFVQEDWEGGLTILLPAAAAKGSKIEIEIDLEGNFLREGTFVANCFYPRSNESWYPRHGYLDRSTYDLRFLHSRRLKVAAVGVRTGEADWPEEKDVNMTSYSLKQPVALVTFALGPWERHTETVKFEGSEKSIPLEFNSVTGARLPIKESFILAELNNSVRYFNAMFGAYPYDSYSATFHPYGFGQGFPSMLMIPPADRSSKYTFAFISHETAHQWWGNIVAWRSYRDQWLSEGFAEYSGALYTSARDGSRSGNELLEEMRTSLKRPPRTMTGTGSGRLNDVGPIILGHRLNSTQTIGAYQALIYNKGALVLRMMHFLLSDPASGDDKAFYAMMKDFVERYRDRSASTDDFRVVASEHFARSPIGQKYQLTDLNWFFLQWVYNSEMPSYQIEHTITAGPDGSSIVSGTVTQQNVSDTFFMPIPISFSFGSNQFAHGTIHAYGPKSQFEIKLPRKPVKVEIDPSKWLLVDKLSVK